LMESKRSSWEIVYDILNNEGLKKTEIMYRTCLTYPQTMRYLNRLIDAGLLTTQPDLKGRNVFKKTERGDRVLGHLAAVVEYLAEGNSDDALQSAPPSTLSRQRLSPSWSA